MPAEPERLEPRLSPAMAPPPPPIAPLRAVAAMSAAAALAFGAGLVAARLTAPAQISAPVDPCALPAGVDLAGLTAADRAYVVRRALLCGDLEQGRIDTEGYRDAIVALDRLPPAPAPPAMVWGGSIRALSSQYGTTSWAANRALGAPDVFPAGGDQVNAWASLGADDRVEHLEIGLEHAARLSAVEVFETFNPGAVSQIELIGQSGARTVVHRGAAAPIAEDAFRRRIDFACTAEPIVAIRLTIDSPAVPGWNEIDAVGGQPCGVR